MKRLSIIFLLLLTTVLGFSPTYLSFNSGQISPLLEARIDFAKYRFSCRTIENMLVTTQGPVFRRPGTKYIATQKDSSAIGRLISYEHSVDDSYVLLLEDQTMRFFRDGGQILSGGGTESDATYDAAGTVISHWKMNEDASNTAVTDYGGSHNFVSSANTSAIHDAGKVGTGSFALEGLYALARSADHDDFTFIEGTNGDFSIAGWVRVTEVGVEQVIMSKWDETTGSQAREWRLMLDNSLNLKFDIADESLLLDSDLAAQFKLNDSAATSAVVEGVNSNDGALSDGENDYTSDHSVTGKVGNALDFDGTDDFITLPDSDDNTDLDLTGNITISAWVNVDDDDITILANRTDYEGVESGYYFGTDATGHLVFFSGDNTGNDNAAAVAVSTNAISVSTWSHIVAIKNSTDIQFYINNVDAGTDTVARATIGYNGAVKDRYIGASFDGSGHTYGGADGFGSKQYTDGRIDNVMVFSKALSSAEVAALYNSGSGIEELGTVHPSTVSVNALDTGWRFVAVTYEGENLSGPWTGATAMIYANLYVDGAEVATTDTNLLTYENMEDTDAIPRIGAQESSAGAIEKIFPSNIDNFAIFSDTMSAADVVSLFTANAIYEISTPYLTADLFDLDFIKSEDVMYISHPDHEPRQLSRLAHDWWSLDALGIGTGPFQAENEDTDLTITPTGSTYTAGSAITLTAASGLFRSGHVGSIWQIDQVRGTSQITGTFTGNGHGLTTPEFSGAYGFTTSGTFTGTITLMRSTNGGGSWRPALTALTDTNFDNPAEIEEDTAIYRAVMSEYGSGSVTYTITITDNANKGVVRITGVQDVTNATATIVTALVDGSATSNWREGYWSTYRGWPETVAIHQQRLTFGGSTTFPQTVWFGKTDPDDYTNFTEGTLDTSAFTVVLAGNNSIQWMLSQDYLFIGNSGSCGKYGDQGSAVTPTSPNYQEQTRQGTASLPAIIAGDAILYVERGSRKIREFVFDFQADKYLSPDLSILSPEITESGIKDVAFQFRPYPILWCVLNNGDIATLTYQKTQSVVAWTKQTTDGDFESITIIPDTTEDEVWVTVKRTIDGETETVVRYIEQFQPQDWGSDPNDAWFVDSGITYSGSPETEFSGADHLDGETVSIYADLLIESPEVVDPNGAFTIDNAASRVLVGMPFTSKLETMPLVIDPQDKAANKKIMSVWFDLYKTGYMEYGNGPDSTLINMNFNNNLDLDNTATAQDFITSRVKLKRGSWGYGTMQKQTVYIENDQPMPLTVRSITPSFNLFAN